MKTKSISEFFGKATYGKFAFIFCITGILSSIPFYWPIGFSKVNSLCIGFGIITYLVFFKYLDLFVISPDANKGVIVQDYFIGVETPGDTVKVEELKIPEGQDALFTGINLVFPWVRPVGEPIPLEKEEPSERSIELTGLPGKGRFKITWVVPLTPVRNKYLVRYKLVTPKVAEDYVHSIVAAAISDAFVGKNGEDISKNVKKFSDDTLSGLFGGENTICDDENRIGRFTNKPFIKTIVRTDESAGTDELANRAAVIAGAVSNIIAASGSNQLAAAMAIASMTGQKLDPNILVGVNPAIATATGGTTP